MKILFSLLGLALIACNNGENKRYDFSSQSGPEKRIDTTVNRVYAKEIANTETDSSDTQLYRKRKISILSIEKKIDSTSDFYEDYNLRCSKWILSKTDATMILQVSKEINGSDFHDYYDVLPCYYTGKAHIDGKVAFYEINAGSFSVLRYKDTSIYLGYNKDDDKKYFLVSPGIK